MSNNKKEYKDQADMPLAAISDGDMLWNRTGSWRNVRPYYDFKTAPCVAGCPAGENIQGYLALVKAGKYEEAVRLIWENNPFPAICGRVCYHPCMTKCARGEYDESLFIPGVERFLGDYAIRNNIKETPPEKIHPNHIAIIGGGPAGLACAYYLARMGYKPTLFEKQEKLGGVLRYGIPPYRLPKNVLDSEIDRILSLGVEAKTGTLIGKDVPVDALKKFDAYFLGVGLQRSRKLGIDGETSEGVYQGLGFLEALNRGRTVSLGKKVIVVGGGNTAMDVARSAIRQGADVMVVYRRTEHEMPAIRDEIEEAREEGVKFKFLATPAEVITEGKKLKEVKFQEMELGAPDDSGRRRPVAKPNAFFTLQVDSMLLAVGEGPNTEAFEAMVTVDHGFIVTDEFGRTSAKKVYAGGDIVTGAATVVNAVARGRTAAQLIHAELTNADFKPDEHKKVVSIADLNTAYFIHQKQAHMRRMDREAASKSFEEVNHGLTEEQVGEEANRCFSCGVCNSCDNCWVFCPDVAISREDGTYTINYDFCKGCLICVEECPRACLSIEEEGK